MISIVKKEKRVDIRWTIKNIQWGGRDSSDTWMSAKGGNLIRDEKNMHLGPKEDWKQQSLFDREDEQLRKVQQYQHTLAVAK